MANLISAKEAASLTRLYAHKEAANKIVSDIASQIKRAAQQGDSSYSVDDKKWLGFLSEEYKLAKIILEDAGYTVEEHEYDYAPNGGRPDAFKAVRVKW